MISTAIAIGRTAAALVVVACARARIGLALCRLVRRMDRSAAWGGRSS
jgi:hypothetical protein